MQNAVRVAVALVSTAWVAGSQAASTPAAATNTGPAKSVDLFADTLVAKGKGLEIKRGELDAAMVSIKAAAAARGQSIPPAQLRTIEAQVLERLIQVKLLLAKATDADKVAAKETADKRMEAIKARAKTDEALNRQPKSMGTSQEELRAKMIDELTAENVLESELKVTVRPEEVKQFYDENPARFEQPEMVRASHILFGTKDSATVQDLPKREIEVPERP